MAKIVCASHILLKTQAQAATVKKALDDRSDFAALAKKYSQCPSAKRGGDLGEFGRGEMVGPFDKAVFSKGSEDKHYLGPVKTKFGYHLIQVLYKI